jgi:hypothetical protein
MADRDRFELDLAAALRTYLEEAPTEVRPTELARQFATDYPPGRTPISLWRFAAIPRPAWVLLLGAALLAALLGGALLVGSQMQRKLPAVVPPVAPSAAPSAGPTFTGTWDPILATIRAKPAPTAATCPPDTDPDTPGPADQERPKAGWTSSLAAAFDRHAGRIVYVDAFGETWTFDVCTNTWHRMNPTGPGIGELSGGLVYDVDSDRTVALGVEHISVYDANTNTWTQPGNDTVGMGDGLMGPMGAVYDPISGLILTTEQGWDGQVENAGYYWELWAYDVDANDWTLIGKERHGMELLGYSQIIDRLIFDSTLETTVLVDPRTGEATPISTDTPLVDLAWPNGIYGPAANTVYVKLRGYDTCGFDSDSLTWNACFDTPVALQEHTGIPAALVGDPINQRLILINGDGRDGWSGATDDVWAIDLDSGAWAQLLEPTNP